MSDGITDMMREQEAGNLLNACKGHKEFICLLCERQNPNSTVVLSNMQWDGVRWHCERFKYTRVTKINNLKDFINGNNFAKEN